MAVRTSRTIALASAVLLGSSLLIAQNTTSPSVSDKKFVKSALEGENAEVKLSQLAAEKGSSPDVKQFGQKMVDDHTKLGSQMKDVAQKEGIRPSTSIASKDNALKGKLSKLSGEAFDKAYIKAMVKDHKQDLANFEKEAASGNDTAIKHAAGQAAEIISSHLQRAEQLARDHHVEMSGNSNGAE